LCARGSRIPYSATDGRATLPALGLPRAAIGAAITSNAEWENNVLEKNRVAAILTG
jgi:hypothetical protein